MRWRARIARTYEINGNSGGGRQILVLGRADGLVSSTICHELGHGMGLSAFINGVNDQNGNAPGMVAPGHVDNGGRAYFDGPAPYTQGRRNLHRGPHCAAGIPAADLPHQTFHGQDGTCIMYGSGGNADTRPDYCPDCLGVLRSRTLTDIRNGWAGRF